MHYSPACSALLWFTWPPEHPSCLPLPLLLPLLSLRLHFQKQVEVRYHVNEVEVHYGDAGIMAPFEMTTTNLAAMGLRCEVVKVRAGKAGRHPIWTMPE